MEQINERISVISVYDRASGKTMPRRVRWQARDYDIKEMTYHHKVREGRTIIHFFHVTDGNVDFRLSLNTETLAWLLIEIYDKSAAQ